MSLPFSILVAREPHRSAIEIARELSARLNAQRAAKRDQKNARARQTYKQTRSWSTNYDNY